MRFNAELSEQRFRQMDTLMQVTGIETKKDLLVNAIALFDWAVRQRLEGRTIASIDARGRNYREMVLPALANIKPVSDLEREPMVRVIGRILRERCEVDVPQEEIERFLEEEEHFEATGIPVMGD